MQCRNQAPKRQLRFSALHSRAESIALFSRTTDEMMKRVAIHSIAPIVLAV